MAEEFDSIFINGKSLRPAPFVSTQYEYNRSGDYVIGGFLVVTLSGSIIGEDIGAQVNELSLLQTETNCVSLKIGCSGGEDFLNGAGRIRSVTINPSDQPYLASYSIQIALEIVDGVPAVEPDEEFLRQTCLGESSALLGFLKSYTETLTISSDGITLANNDGTLNISKSYVKASGRISLSSFMREICGIPKYNGIENSITIIKDRAKALMSMNICVPGSPLSQFSGWNKWLDTKSLTIDSSGAIEWSFEMYLSKGSGSPYAWIDINTEDSMDQKRQASTSKISGTIKGLSSANIDDYLSNKAAVNERIINAELAYNNINSLISNGTWPSDTVLLSGDVCIDPTNTTCPPNKSEQCRQRLSSTIKKIPISGEITFNAEYGPISSCKPKGVGSVEFTIEEQLPANRHIEYIIPGAGKSIIANLNAPTPKRAQITARGTLTGCDKLTLPDLIKCVNAELQRQMQKMTGAWMQISEKRTVGTFSYTITRDFIYCG